MGASAPFLCPEREKGNIMIGINAGHTKSGAGYGAVGIIRESEHTRKVAEALKRYLEESGSKIKDCTIDAASTQNAYLAKVVELANGQELEWFISIHFNAGGGRGIEVYTYEGRQYQDAVDVCRNIAALGFTNRGVKKGTGLYVIHKTKAKSMLIEVCFVDTDDANRYLAVGADKIGQAIAAALIPYVVPSVSTGSVAIASTIYNGLDYAPVFDAAYYAGRYKDLKAVYGNDAAALFNHFIAHGMSEGRQAIDTFNVQAYKARYTDLQKAFGENLMLYYQHYIRFGAAEGRKAL